MIGRNLGSLVAGWVFGLALVVLNVMLLILIGLHVYLSCKGLTTFEFLTNKKTSANETVIQTNRVEN